MPTITTQPITAAQISSPVRGDNDKLAPSHLPSPQVAREIRAYHGLQPFFGSGRKIHGETHAERIMSAAEGKDRSKLMNMILPGAVGTDSLRKLSTAAGTIIGAQYEEGKEVKAIIPPEAEHNSQRIEPLMARYEAGNLDSEGKRQLMQGLAYRAYTLPMLKNTDGHDVTFGQLCTTLSWDKIPQENLSQSDIAPRLNSTLSDFRKVYEIAASFPQNKPPTSTPTYSAKAKGLRKLLQEAQKGHKEFFNEAKRQTGKFNHRAASFLKAKPYVDSDLDEVFSSELRDLKPHNREHIEKRIIENQVRTTIEQRKNRVGASLSPDAIAKEIKQKSNYRHLTYQDKEKHLTNVIAKAIAAPSVVQQPASKADEGRQESKSGDDRPTSKAAEDRPTSKAGEKPLEDFSSGTSSQEVPGRRALSVEDVLADKDLSLEDAVNSLLDWYTQNPQSSRS